MSNPLSGLTSIGKTVVVFESGVRTPVLQGGGTFRAHTQGASTQNSMPGSNAPAICAAVEQSQTDRHSGTELGGKTICRAPLCSESVSQITDTENKTHLALRGLRGPCDTTNTGKAASSGAVGARWFEGLFQRAPFVRLAGGMLLHVA